MHRIRSGIIGTGFIGGVHAAAVRAAGGVVQAVASATAEGAKNAAAAWHAEHTAMSGLDLIARDDIDVVHICTPNATHAELAHAAIAAGKAVVCEKPLAINPESATGLVGRATAAGAVTAVPFIYRYYPTVREARDRISRDEAGRLWLLHGSYLQDWLSGRQVSNWRVDPKLGGTSRAFGDIGVHWCDLMEFVTGHRITRLVSHWANAHTERPSPTDASDVAAAVATEDGAIVTFETDRGAAGSVVVSQVSLGRRTGCGSPSTAWTPLTSSTRNCRTAFGSAGCARTTLYQGVRIRFRPPRAATPDYRPAIRRATRIRSPPLSGMCTRRSPVRHQMVCPLSRTVCGPPGSPRLSSSPHTVETG